jgi:hypothetical protein
MMSRQLIIELPAYGPSRGGNHPKTLRGPVGKERPAGPRSHTRGGMRPSEWLRERHPWLRRVAELSPDLQTFLSRADD